MSIENNIDLEVILANLSELIQVKEMIITLIYI